MNGDSCFDNTECLTHSCQNTECSTELIGKWGSLSFVLVCLALVALIIISIYCMKKKPVKDNVKRGSEDSKISGILQQRAQLNKATSRHMFFQGVVHSQNECLLEAKRMKYSSQVVPISEATNEDAGTMISLKEYESRESKSL